MDVWVEACQGRYQDEPEPLDTRPEREGGRGREGERSKIEKEGGEREGIRICVRKVERGRGKRERRRRGVEDSES
jgi:hypothetical protein